MKLFKKIIPFIVISMLITLFPNNVKASEVDVLTGFSFDQPINTNYDYSDFAGQETIMVFGRTEENSSVVNLVTSLDNVVSSNKLSDRLNIIYFDFDTPVNEVSSFVAQSDWKYVHVYSGGNSEMWNTLKNNGVNVNNGVRLPVVFYIKADGQLQSITYGSQQTQSIANGIKELINWSGEEQGTEQAAEYKVLADATNDDFEKRRAEIEKKMNAIDEKLKVSYEVAPKAIAPYAAGTVKNSYLQNALKALNLVRYLSGLPEVTLNEQYNSYAQHGAVLMSASEYGHYPTQPSDMSKTFYETGYSGTSQGNIYWGYNNLVEGIIHGWMADEGTSNIDRVGHRRWALNPFMGATGFGEVNSLAVMYAFDYDGLAPEFDAIAYPSGAAFPSEYFQGDYPWNITLNTDIFAEPDLKEVTVKLTGGGKTYHFSAKDNKFSGNYFNIDTGGYGIDNSIIFRPKGIEEYIGTYQVEVKGLKTIMGEEVTLSYETTFFNDSFVKKPSTAQTINTPSSWATEGVERAKQLGLVPSTLTSKFTNPITRAEFSQLAVVLYEKIKGTITPTVQFTDTTDINVSKMATIGVVEGTGDGKFSPNDKLTREQAAKMLDLLLVKLGYSSHNSHVVYADEANIASWAKNYVNSISNHSIMGGVGNNKFDPKGSYTREQSIVTMLRIWDFAQ